MRKPRRITLGSTGLFHKMWRGHNREPVLESDTDKRSYLGHLAATQTDAITTHVAWFSFCLMTNHAHETGRLHRELDRDLDEAVQALGCWMRNAHSRFGAEYNRRHGRQGKVAYDRPKTSQIDDDQGVLTAMFYGDANPVRAGMVSHPARYRHSSHRFYAYGERSELTDHLTLPPAYLGLGQTPEVRQRRYRQACDAYLRREGLIEDRPSEQVDQPVAATAPQLPATGPGAGAPPARGDPRGDGQTEPA